MQKSSQFIFLSLQNSYIKIILTSLLMQLIILNTNAQIHDTLNIRKYQTFDEFSMRGIGDAKEDPFVYVKETKDTVWVLSSCKQDSTRMYVKINKGLWLNHMEYDMWKKNDMAYKCKECRIARTYDRYIYNDTIMEIYTGYIEGEGFPRVIVRTQKELCEIDIDSMIITNISDFRTYVYQITNSNGKNVCKYELKTSDRMYSYVGDDNNPKYEYEKKAYGLWGIMPGVEETFLYGRIDIREYADSLKSFQSNNPNFIYEFTDIQPTFPEGYSALQKFVKGMRNDALLYEQNNKRVIIEVVVEKDGSISNAKVSKSVDWAHDNDALKIINNMPNWIPAMLNGKPIRCKAYIPISYRK